MWLWDLKIKKTLNCIHIYATGIKYTVIKVVFKQITASCYITMKPTNIIMSGTLLPQHLYGSLYMF